MLKKTYLFASMICLGTMGAAQAEQWSGNGNSAALTMLAQANIDELYQRPSYLNLDQDTNQSKHNFEQVQSADDGDTRVNLAMNFLLQKKQKDEVNLQLGAVSLEFPEDDGSQLAVDVRPFFYLGLGSRW